MLYSVVLVSIVGEDYPSPHQTPAARITRRTILKEGGLNDPDNHDGAVLHPEPDILEREIKKALGSIGEGNGNPLQ